MLLATEVAKLTRRQAFTVFRVQRPNITGNVSYRLECCQRISKLSLQIVRPGRPSKQRYIPVCLVLHGLCTWTATRM